MNRRLKGIGGSLLVTLLGYFAYSAFAMPWLEPSIELAPVELAAMAPEASPRDRGFERLFPRDAWELERPKVLETDRGTVIFDDYKTLPESRLQLSRCSLILWLERGANKADSRPVVLRAPEGAVLFFEGKLNIPRGEFGRLIGGELAGEVHIYSPPGPDKDDGLDIKTRDVRVEESRIWTPREVTFRYGPNSGSGSDLSITMHPPERDHEGKRSASGIGRARELELVHVDGIQLLLPADKFALPGVMDDKPTPSASEATPVDVECQGPLRFDFDEQVLSLNQGVDLIRHNVDGPSDQLNCERLLVHFASDAQTGKEASNEDETSQPLTKQPRQLKPSKIVALGGPATLRLDSMQTFIRAEELEFDFDAQRIFLHDRQGVEVRNARYQIASREIEYELGQSGRLGRMWAAGPGYAVGAFGKDERRCEAHWSGEARLQPFDGAKVLSLINHARITAQGTGEFSANELHVFLVERPRPDQPERFTVVPDRMKAVGDIHFNSLRLSGTLQEANIWFEADETTVEPANPSAFGGAIPLPGTRKEDSASPPAEQRGLEVSAMRLNAEIRLSTPPQVIQLAATGNVHCWQAELPGLEPGIDATCDTFQLLHGDTTNPLATLQGKPARVTARGSTLLGDTMHVHLGDNVAIVDGAGQMILARETDGEPLQIDWRRQMRFDGQRARFEGEVVARGSRPMQNGDRIQFNFRGEALDALLTEHVRFQEANETKTVELRELVFSGACNLQNQTFDAQGQRKSSDHAQLSNLRFDQGVGRLHGQGPGWLTSVHYGRELFDEGPLAATGEGLHFLRVDFARELIGNVNLREIEFLGQAQCAYGPVSSWDQVIDTRDLSRLGPRDVVITSQRLALVDMGSTENRFDAIELEATGNAFVRGQTFTASGQRVSYAKAKDQLVLEGDGRNYAILTYQHGPNTSPAPLQARKILFWPETKQFELNDFRSLDLRNLGEWRQPRP